MKLVLLQVGKTDKDYLLDGIKDFNTRINRLAGFETLIIPDLKNRKSLKPEDQKREEALRIANHLKTGDYIILLDERGKQYNSKGFAAVLQKLFTGSYKRIIFVIGGPYGFSESLYSRCNLKISLSSMTFPHQLVRLLFMEQLYRGLSILKGLPYHNE